MIQAMGLRHMQYSNILKINRDFADSSLPSDSSSLELRLEKGDLIYPSWSLDSIFNSDELKILFILIMASWPDLIRRNSKLYSVGFQKF